ncbi:hypothetical protein ACFV0L_30560 [Streptosporangium canum]|uniref:hypothetical protein n=1 Tax=Streptosporangium canum TaxID=324952 RepID=UPI0036754BE7
MDDCWLPYPPAVTDYARERAAIHRPAPHPITPACTRRCAWTTMPSTHRLLRKSIERYYNAPLEKVEQIQAMFAGPLADAAWLNSSIAAGARHPVIRLTADDRHTALEKFAARVEPLLNL